MTPRPISKDCSSKVQSILNFATHLNQWISEQSTSQNQSLSDSSFPDSDLYFAALPLARSDVSPRERVELDRKGVQLWNSCCSFGGDEGDRDKKLKGHIAKARALAWLLVESAAREKGKDVSATKKTFRTASQAAKDCMTSGHLQLGAKLIERLAERYSQMQEAITDQDEEVKASAGHLQAELLLLQLTLAWKRERLDMAEHFYNLLTTQLSNLDSLDSVKVVDLLYEIGMRLMQDGQSELAGKWLGRASAVMDCSENDCCPTEWQELRLNVLHTYVRALLETNRPESRNEAARILEVLKSEYGHKLAVTLLEIEILSREPSPNVETYYSGLTKVIRTVHLIKANHNLIMHYVHHLKTMSLTHALKALKQYIVQRLAPDEVYQGTEGAIVTFIWMRVSDPTVQTVPAELGADLNLFHQIWNRSLNAEAAHAAFLLLWKQIEHVDCELGRLDVISWCNVALTSLLENAGDHNVGKIQRKLVICHMKVPDLQAANEALAKMPKSAREHALSLYLAYSVALRCRDEAKAEAALASILKLRDKDSRLLLACVGETMKYGDQRQGAKLLQRVLDKFNYELPPEIDTCVLLRCTARLLMSVLSEEQHPDPEMLSRLCVVFKAAAKFSTKCNDKGININGTCPSPECRWFQRNSHNLALQHVKDWPTKYVIDLIEYSSQVCYPPEPVSGAACSDDNLKHHVTNNFVQIVLYLAEARKCTSSQTIEDPPQTSYHAIERPEPNRYRLHLYQNCFNKYSRLHQKMVECQANSIQSEHLKDNLKAKLIAVLPLAFEALLFISSADATNASCLDDIGLLHLIDEASELSAPAKTFALLADLILSSTIPIAVGDEANGAPRVPLPTAIKLLGRVINAIRNEPEYDVVRAARWIRCVVQLVLDRRIQTITSGDGDVHQGANTLDVVETIVDEALSLARDATNTTSPANRKRRVEAYPSDELHWLSTTLFNLAVDFYVAEKQDEARKWASKAVELADTLGRNPRNEGGDDGALARVLRDRQRRMDWGG